MSRSGLLGQRHWHGAEGIDAFTEEWVGAWEDWSLEVIRIREGNPGQVVTECTQRGKADGVPVEMHFAQLWTLNEDGRATRMNVYLDVDEALAEAGLGAA